eukprot:COSAG02_NODE_9070_length_2342_cov_9.063089_2_plen_251_part_00
MRVTPASAAAQVVALAVSNRTIVTAATPTTAVAATITSPESATRVARISARISPPSVATSATRATPAVVAAVVAALALAARISARISPPSVATSATRATPAVAAAVVAALALAARISARISPPSVAIPVALSARVTPVMAVTPVVAVDPAPAPRCVAPGPAPAHRLHCGCLQCLHSLKNFAHHLKLSHRYRRWRLAAFPVVADLPDHPVFIHRRCDQAAVVEADLVRYLLRPSECKRIGKIRVTIELNGA